jgi:hypothetical protein
MQLPSFTTLTTDSLAFAAPKQQVSQSELDSLLKDRRFNAIAASDPTVPECDPNELKELEDYCKKRGIIGVNFAGMSPRAILQMLRGKTEGVASVSKRGLLYD